MMYAGLISAFADMPSNPPKIITEEFRMDKQPRADAPSGSGMTVASAFESLLTAEKASVQHAKPKGHKKRIIERQQAVDVPLGKLLIQDDASLASGQVRPFPITIAMSP